MESPPAQHRASLRVAAVVLAALLGACSGSGGEPDFDDHTVPSFESEDAYFAFADLGETPIQAKFVITRFGQAGSRVRFLEGGFYQMHDEWYWFRLLNGQEVDGFDTEPVDGEYGTVAEIVDALRGVEDLPLDLRFYGERLYSPSFYEAAGFSGGDFTSRSAGLGSVLYFPPDERRPLPEALWLFELEYGDRPDEAALSVFFERIGAVLPASIRPQLRWLARASLYQEGLAAELKAGDGPFADRVVTYDQLAVQGEIVGYNPGIAAGHIRRFPVGALGESAVGPEDIVVSEAVPDDLPPVAAIITAAPQTPLAHLNVLAKARGTPNAYVGGVMSDASLEAWEYYRSHVIVEVGPESVRWKAITEDEYDRYAELSGKGAVSVPRVEDLSSRPYFVDLTEGGLAEMPDRVPLCGGKAAAMAVLVAREGIEAPPRPVCITIRAYREHIEPVLPLIEKMLALPEFSDDVPPGNLNARRQRFMVLEGPDRFAEDHAEDAAALAWADTFLASKTASLSPYAELVAAGGLRNLVRDRPPASELHDALRALLTERFADLVPLAGLRFRSSSTAEDVPGFNGAGLYDSNTGYIHPEIQPTSKLRERSLDWALSRTWASYWTFEAFEERRLSRIPHLDGNMGVLVHPTFTDADELANGVVTFRLARTLAGDDDVEMVVNIQLGAVSVTNPDPASAAAPEVDVLRRVGGADPEISRERPSDLVEPGIWLLSEAELAGMAEELGGLARAWLDQQNDGLAPPQQSSTVVLDLEIKRMAAPWPALIGAPPRDDRLVFKQVRTIDRALPDDDDLLSMPIPRDLLAAAVRIRQWTCETALFRVSTYQLNTDPSGSTLAGYATSPFTSHVALRLESTPEGSTIKPGVTRIYPHTTFAETAHTEPPAGPHSFGFTLLPQYAAAFGFDHLEYAEDGSWELTWPDGSLGGTDASCASEDLLVGPADYLRGLLD